MPLGVTLLAPLGDFPLEQSHGDSLKHAFDQGKVIDGQLLKPGWVLSYPHFSLIEDDIIIYSNDWQQQIQHLRAVLRSRRWTGLMAKPKKCVIGRVENQIIDQIFNITKGTGENLS
ncbi:hypothetical protein SRHO_G00029490 [Serrasalmus rhombeus]